MQKARFSRNCGRSDSLKSELSAKDLRKGNSHYNLEDSIHELTVKLAVANEALRAKTDRCKLAEKALKESRRKCRLLKAEYSQIIHTMQDQLQKAQKMEELGKIVAPAFTHDLKNLLTAISSMAQFSIERMSLTPPLEEPLLMILENSQKADRLIRSFLDFVKTVKFDRLLHEPININRVVNKAWRVAKYSTLSHHVTFVRRLEKKLPKVMGDPENVERVFLNLFLNAIQAVPEKGRVVAETKSLLAGEGVEINVVDNGPGIPKEYRDSIFEPFFTTKEGGTGLGLSTCQAIIQQHKGTITVDSDSKSGTKVSVRLPAAPTHP